ncbi:hypothetical protein B0H13DRAFT_2264072 [Mycena leptocephala]|nr:hypothetical protein B0H13DRAFT_2264072 [Mycena leptocephala]
MRLRLKERGVALAQYERRVFHRGTLFPALPAAFVSASLEWRTLCLHPTTHCAGTQCRWYPAATQTVPTPLQVLLGERKIHVHAIGYYAPTRMHPPRQNVCRLELTSRYPLTTLLPRNASSAPPSYPPLPVPASARADTKQHAHACITTCATHLAKTAQAPRPAHKPSPADERAHTHPCHSRLESRTRERKVGVKGARAKRETRKEKRKEKRASAHPPHPQPLQHLGHRVPRRGRDTDGIGGDDGFVGRRPGSTARELIVGGEREDVEGTRVAHIARTEASTVGPPQLPKRARIARGKVGGHAHREGERHAPARRFLLPWYWDPATHIRLCVKEGGTMGGGGEEGEEGENSMILTSIPNNQTIAAPAPPVLTDARCAKEFGGGFRRRCCGGKKRPRKWIGRWTGNTVDGGRRKDIHTSEADDLEGHVDGG